MAIKNIQLHNLETFANKLKQDYAKKIEVTAVETRVKALEDANVQENVLEGVKVNGTALDIANKMVDILVTTGTTNGTIQVNGTDVSVQGLANMAYKTNVSQADLDTALTEVIAAKAEANDVYNKEEIDAKISSVYKPAGSVAFAALPTASADVLGNVYNVTDAFTTTANFVEGEGNTYPAGTNVVVVVVEEDTYKYDVLAGFVDLSGYVVKETGKGLSTNDYTTDEKTKLANITENATKVEASTTNGNIKINGADTKVYELPNTVLHNTDFEEVTAAEILALFEDEEEQEEEE